jgi:hypothetical protein
MRTLSCLLGRQGPGSQRRHQYVPGALAETVREQVGGKSGSPQLKQRHCDIQTGLESERDRRAQEDQNMHRRGISERARATLYQNSVQDVCSIQSRKETLVNKRIMRVTTSFFLRSWPLGNFTVLGPNEKEKKWIGTEC